MSSQEELMKELMASGTAPSAANKDQQAFKLASSLLKLLGEESVPNALWWLDSKHFAVDPKHFQGQVLDPHFRGTKYASFLRTMHKMGFARISRSFALPKGVVAYACENFQKDKPDLLKNIKMNNSGKQAKAAKLKAAAAAARSEAASIPTPLPGGAGGDITSQGKRRRSSGSDHSATASAVELLESKRAAVAALAAAAPINESFFTANKDLSMDALEQRIGMSAGMGGTGSLFSANNRSSALDQQIRLQRMRELALAEERSHLALLAQARAQVRAAEYQRFLMGDHSSATSMYLRNGFGGASQRGAQEQQLAAGITKQQEGLLFSAPAAAAGIESKRMDP